MVENVQQVYVCTSDVRATNGGANGAFCLRVNGVPGGYPEYASTSIIPVVKSGARCREAAAGKYGPPLADPNAWYAEFELTIPPNWDWNDLVLLIEPQGNGTTKVTYFQGNNGGTVNAAGLSFDLLDANHNVIAFNILYLQYGFAPDSSPGASYAMNGQAGQFLFDDSGKILCLDYNITIANLVAPANSGLASWPTDIAPRHSNSVNVLFFDGHAETRSVLDIDPNVATNLETLWTSAQN